MGTMKILYFHQHFSTPLGATSTRSYEMAKRLIARGHQVTMVCGSYDGGITGLNGSFVKGHRRGKVDDIEIIEFNIAYSNHDSFFKRTLVFMNFSVRSIKLVFTESYDLIFATSTPLTVAIPGIFARWFRRKPFVLEVRDLWPELPKAMGVITNRFVLMVMSGLEWASYHSALRMIGLSPGMIRGIAGRGVSEEKIKLLPNGCDLDLFANRVTPWRPSQIRDTDFLAIFAGTHGQANGLDALLNVALELKQRGRDNIKILLIGQGKLKPGLQQRAYQESLNNIIFHPPVDKTHLAGLMQSADIGLQILANVPAFYYGTSPNKFFDYIAAGLPVLNNYPGWLADLIRQYDCGIVVPPDDPGAFADALEFSADHRKTLHKQGLRARQLAENNFNRFNIANDFVNWLEEV